MGNLAAHHSSHRHSFRWHSAFQDAVSVVADEYLPLVVDIEIVTVTVTRRGEDILVLQTLKSNPN